MTPVTDVAESTSTDPTRERLLSAAAEVFAEKGYDRAGVQEIAHRAGFTTGAIYGRFRGKADLLLAAMEGQSADEFAELFAQSHLPDSEVKTANVLSTVGTHLVTDDFDNGQALLLEAFVAARRDPEVATMLRKTVEARATEMTELIETAKQLGAIDEKLDTLAVVRFCQAVCLGFLLFGAIDLPRPEAGPWGELIDLLVDAVGVSSTAPSR
jgi:AcrR family transcriptional regulator